MNYTGYSPFEIDRWGSLVTLADPLTLPLGLASVAKNVRYKPTTVMTRYGVFTTLSLPKQYQGQNLAPAMIVACGSLPVLGTPMAYLPFLFDYAGRLWIESMVGLNVLKQVTPSLYSLPAGARMRYTTAYGRAYMGFSDLLLNSMGQPMALDGRSRNLDPISYRPMAQSWQATTQYVVGEVIIPITPNGHKYRCTAAGTSGAAQPAFPTGAGAIVVDGTVTWKESTPAGASSGTGGNICTGTRLMVVLYQNRNGYIQGMDDHAPIAITPANASQQLNISNIPIGPANCVRRILAFTQAGADIAGPYFYIPAADSANGVSQSATVLNDNISTALTVNFTDDFLGEAVSVTDYFRKIQIQRAVDIYYAESMDRMVYLDPVLYPSGFLVSLKADPESVYGDTGVVQVANQDGGWAVCWREFKGVQYALKSNGGHEVKYSDEDPATWDVERRWGGEEGRGPCGPWAAAANSDVLAFAHRSGPYIWDGSNLTGVGDEILLNIWKGINWTKEHLIWCAVDEVEKEVHFGVPYGDSPVCNKEIVVNYRDGWNPPYRMSSFTGHMIALLQARKWSINDIPANMAVRVERDISANVLNLPIPADPQEYDRVPLRSQFLYASASPLGEVMMQTPGVYNDNGAGIDSAYQTGYAPQGGEQMVIPPGQVWDLGFFSLRARGSGALQIALFRDKSKQPYLLPSRMFDFTGREDDVACGLFGLNGNLFTALIWNRAVPDCWFELERAAFHVRSLFAGPRPSGGISGPQ